MNMKKFDLHKQKIPNPFVEPENYSEKFAENLYKRIEGNEEPARVSKKLPFGTPQNYFELLPQRIMKRIATLKKKVWYREKRTWQWAVLTCSVVFLVWAGQNLLSEYTKSAAEKAEIQLSKKLKSIDKEELEQFLVSNQHKEFVLSELQKVKIEVKDKLTQHSENIDILLQEVSKDDLEEAIPEQFLKEAIDDEALEGQSLEDTFSEKDTI